MLTVWCGFGREGIAIILLFVGFFLERVLLAAAVLDRQQQMHDQPRYHEPLDLVDPVSALVHLHAFVIPHVRRVEHERANCDRINTRRKRERYLRHADLYASTGNSEHRDSYSSQV